MGQAASEFLVLYLHLLTVLNHLAKDRIAVTNEYYRNTLLFRSIIESFLMEDTLESSHMRPYHHARQPRHALQD